VKSDPAARARHLDARLPGLDRAWRDAAVGSEDAFDAAVSAIAMSRHEAQLRTLPGIDDAAARFEGRVWCPLATASPSAG
jgi:hypothetical protein